jgi:hypothetical protein
LKSEPTYLLSPRGTWKLAGIFAISVGVIQEICYSCLHFAETTWFLLGEAKTTYLTFDRSITGNYCKLFLQKPNRGRRFEAPRRVLYRAALSTRQLANRSQVFIIFLASALRKS